MLHSLIRRGSQIFSLIHPRDLIQVSWTSKVLNRFLTSRSSRHVWQASFKTIPENEMPPPCPPEITEFTYVNLLYFKFCMVCVPAVNRIVSLPNQRLQNCGSSGPPIPGTAWSALTRLCGPCVNELYFFHLSSAPFGHSAVIPRAISLCQAVTDDSLHLVFDMVQILPTFDLGACRFPWNSPLAG